MNFIYTDSYFYNALSVKFDFERISEMLKLQHKFVIIGYLVLPVIFMLKIFIISGVLFAGTYLIQPTIAFKNCLKIAILAELVSVIFMLAKATYLLFTGASSETNMKYLRPLSLSGIINLKTVPNYLLYPLQLFNVFELAYWLVLAFGVAVFTKQSFLKGLKMVASSYGVALFIWVIFVVFIQVQYAQ